MRKRLLSALLSLCMVLTMLPVYALAEEAEDAASISSATLRMKVGETRTITFDSGMYHINNDTSTTDNATVSSNSVFTESDTAVTDAAIPDGYYYIKGTRQNSKYWSNILTSNKWGDKGDKNDFDWLQYSDTPAIYQVTRNEDGTYALKDNASDKFLSSKYGTLSEAIISNYGNQGKEASFSVASMQWSDSKDDSAFTITATSNNSASGHSVSADGVAYVNSLGGYARALLYKTAASDVGSVMNFYKVGYTTTVTVEATSKGTDSITVCGKKINIIVSDANAFQDIYVGAGQSADVTVATENSYTDKVISSDNDLRVTATGSQVELGEEVEFRKDLPDGTYALQDQRNNGIATPEKRYLTDEIKHVNDFKGRDVITQSDATDAGVYTFSRNEDGTYSVKTSNGYLDTKTFTMDENGASGPISSVAWTDDASNSAITLVGSSADNYIFGLKTQDKAGKDATLESWGGYQYSMWANHSAPSVSSGSAYYLYPATVKTTLHVVGRTTGEYEVQFDKLTLRIHVVDAVRVPVMGSVSVPCSATGNVKLSGNLSQYVTADVSDGEITFTNNSADGLTVGKILTGTATVGSTVFSVSIGIDESVEMASGTSKTFVYKDGTPVVSGGLDVASTDKNKATLVESVSDIRDGGEYLLAGMRIQTVAGSEEIDWNPGSTKVHGLKKLSGIQIKNDTTEFNLTDALASARFRFEKVGENTYNLYNVSAGKYLKSDAQYSLSLTPYQSDAAKVTVSDNPSNSYGEGMVYLGIGEYHIGDWGGSNSQGLTLLSKASSGTELKLFAAEDKIATVTANDSGYVTVGGKTYQITVFSSDNAAAELNGTSYSTVQAAANAAKSGDEIVLKNTAGTAETVEIPVGITVKSGDDIVFADAYYEVKDNDEVVATVPVKSENGKAILFLPSAANNVELTAENLNLKSGVVLTTSDSVATATLTKDNVTLTKTFTVAKAGNIASVFISDLKEENDETAAANINWMNASKSNVGVKGKLCKVTSDGKVSVSSDVKKMKGRGNTSWGAASDGNAATDKKPYNITLEGKASLVDGAAEAKKWCLIANNYADFSGVNNYTAYTMYQAIEGNSSMKCEPIDLYVNGEYRGIYLVTDKVEIGESRVNVPESKYSTAKGTPETQVRVIVDDYDSHFDAKGSVEYWKYAKSGATSTAKADDPALSAGVLAYAYASEQTQDELNGGYVLEISHQYTDEAGWFITKHGVMISFKEPERPTQAQVQAAAIYVQEFEDALYSETGYNSLGKHYSEYLDLNSMAKTYLLSCFTGQNDMLDCSDYLNLTPTYEDGKISGGLLMGGPAWDYDVSQYNIDKLYADKTSTNVNGNQAWISQLLKRGDFTDALYQLKTGAFAKAVADMPAKINAYGTKVASSLAMDQLMWNRGASSRNQLSAQEQFNTQRSRFDSRITSWDNVWNDSALKGVSVSEKNGTFTATANTTGTVSYQWYQIDASDKTKMTECSGATEATFTPEEEGTYLVKVTGTAMNGKDVPDTMYSAAVTKNAEPDEIEVTFNAAGGEVSTASKNVSSNGTYGELPTPTRDGYRFVGWFTETEAGEQVTAETTVSNTLAHTLYAHWVQKIKPEIAIAPDKTDLTGGGTVELTVSGVPSEGKLAVTCDNDIKVSEKNGKYTAELPNETQKYTFTASYTGADVYTDAFDTCVVNVTRKSSSSHSSSSSSSTTNTVSASKANNGTVSLDKSSAKKGDTVTITVTPKDGYKLDKLTVTDSKGNTITVTNKGNGKYTFTMPDGKVTVTPTFVAEQTSAEQPSDTKSFSDVKSADWFASAVDYVVDKGMMNGVGNNKFAPNDSTTRGMLMTVIARYAGEDTTGSNPWYQKGMEWAKSAGVSDGTAPNANITREQLVTMLYRYAKSVGKDVSIGEDTNILSYADATTVSEYAIPAMQWACGAGIVNGSNGKLNPKNNATRAEVAAILMRFCENVK